MSHVWVIGARTYGNGLKSSESSVFRSFRIFFCSLSRQCTRPIHQTSELDQRFHNRRWSPYGEDRATSWSFRNAQRPRIYQQQPVRSFTTSNPTAARAVRATPRNVLRDRRPLRGSHPIPLWERYTASAGVPLHGGALEPSFVASIFGNSVNAEEGNLVLRRLQHRRLSGALAHEPLNYLPSTSLSPSELAEKGLGYLRDTFPMDEQGRAEHYAEAEAKKARKAEKEAIQRAQRLRLYKVDEESEELASPGRRTKPGRRRRQLQEISHDPIYGDSVLDRTRRANEARHREQQELEEDAAAADATNPGALSPTSSTSISTPREPSAWVQKWTKRAQFSDTPEAPTLSITQRIGPSLLFFLLLLGGSLLYTTTYTPPARSSRLFPNTPTALATIGALITTNLIFFLAWRIPPLWPVLNRYFVLCPGAPVPLALLGNVFSHQTVAHCALNMVMLALLGTRLHEQIGRAPFLALYVTAGAAGGLASLTFYTLTRNLVTTSLGASGAVAGVLAAVCLLDARPLGVGGGDQNVEDKSSRWGWLEGMVPLPGVMLLTVMMAADVVGLRTRRQPVDHVAHLGGYAAGIVGSWLLNRSFREEANARGGKRENTIVKTDREEREG